MTYNELKKDFEECIFCTTEEGWKTIKETRGKCEVLHYDYEYYDIDNCGVVYFDVKTW